MGILDDLDKTFDFNSPQPAPGPSTPQSQGESSKDNPFAKAALLAARARQHAQRLDEEDSDYDEDSYARQVAGGSQLLDSLRSGAGAKSSASGGFSLRYDNETELRAMDVAGPGQEERLAEFVSKEIDNNSQGLDVKTAMESLELSNPRDILPGLEFRLLGHQAIGVAWMIKMEKEERYKGGILADDMGLGKTVQMIALMSKNMPTKKDEDKTTLIVVPAALMQQWKDEILTKSNDLFSVHLHHGRDKLKKESQVRRKDVIITSYQTLCQDFTIPKDVEPWEEAEWVANNGGLLARTKFYRVIADEAQFIRNRATKASVSLALVRSKYRWMLTGTPVTNTLADLYGLLRFGRFAPWNDWPSFNEHIARVQVEDAPLAGQRAQVILKPLLLRRTKNSMLEGKPILELPPKEIELVKLQFSREERELYDHIEKNTTIRLNKFIRERTLLKNYSEVLVMILRLRQMCCHPNLILAQTGDYDDPALLMGSNNEKELGRARKNMGIAWLTRTKQQFLARAAAIEILDFSDEDDAEAPGCPVCEEAYNNNAQVLGCGHEVCADCVADIRNSPIAHNGIFDGNLAAEKAFEEAQAKGYKPCPTCHEMIDVAEEKVFMSAAFQPTDEELTNYARSKRRAQGKKNSYSPINIKGGKKLPPPSPSGSVIELSDSDEEMPDILSMFKKPSPVGKKGGKRKNTIMSSDDDSMDDLLSKSRKGKGKGKAKRKAADDSDSEVEFLGISPSKRKNNKRARATPMSDEEDDDRSGVHEPSAATLATWSRGDDDMEASTKMTALVTFLKEWDASGDKVICYSQWTSMLDLLEILLTRHGVRSLRFDGKMDRKQRDHTLQAFKERTGPKIILISTKAGSVGLNLVSANRVVNMDLSWNYATESQAYDRCHRIGQEKSVYVKRLVVENTIEERMLKLQDVKTGLAEAALGEGTGGKLHKLSVKDIKYLFGITPAQKEAAKKANERGNGGSRSRNASNRASPEPSSD
ncbi:hypothetical protein D9611_000760 [Ephemerocybe angulata]|uniref:Uncharacterized protein n=1 Tax=Ephemerocybe angulata TaxID=980116 RepID=A0A8H5F6Y2_9AGAR|nr:hypothetical protein D9611_000760 [Tulosesus angulatus]